MFWPFVLMFFVTAQRIKNSINNIPERNYLHILLNKTFKFKNINFLTFIRLLKILEFWLKKKKNKNQPTLTTCTACSGSKSFTSSIWASTHSRTTSLASLYCFQRSAACWYLVHSSLRLVHVSSQAVTASSTAASTFWLTSGVQLSANGFADDFNSVMSDSRFTRSPETLWRRARR